MPISKRWNVVIKEKRTGVIREYPVQTNRRYKAVYLAMLKFMKNVVGSRIIENAMRYEFEIFVKPVGDKS